MGRFVIVAYRPKPGKERELRATVEKHIEVLREQSLVTAREAYVMSGSEGVLIEVFEWADADAIQAAHKNEAVQALWSEFDAVCDYVPLRDLPESGQLFAEFDALNLNN